MYEEELSNTNKYWVEVNEMERRGANVPPEDQIRDFANTINIQAGRSGVNMVQGGRTTTSTNQFFIELSRSIGVQSPEQPLVDFLYNLGSSNSLIRVRDLNLRPDPPRQQIFANVTLIASYQKKTTARPADSAGKSPGAASLSRARAQPATPTRK